MTKICPAFNCGIEFETKPQYNQIYCSHRCYRKEKVRRRKQRTHGVEPSVEVDTRILSTLRFPSIEQLDLLSKAVTEDRPIEVIGMNCMWSAPTGVAFVKQQEQKDGEDVWVMFKQETPDIMELYAKGNE